MHAKFDEHGLHLADYDHVWRYHRDQPGSPALARFLQTEGQQILWVANSKTCPQPLSESSLCFSHVMRGPIFKLLKMWPPVKASASSVTIAFNSLACFKWNEGMTTSGQRTSWLEIVMLCATSMPWNCFCGNRTDSNWCRSQLDFCLPHNCASAALLHALCSGLDLRRLLCHRHEFPPRALSVQHFLDPS